MKPRARIESLRKLEKRVFNKLDWGLRALDIDPKGRTGEELLAWARAKLEELTTESVQDSDRIAAARALVSSAHAEIEFLEKKRQFEKASQAGNTGQQPALPSRVPFESLSSSEKRKAIATAKQQLAELERQLPESDESGDPT